MQMGFVYQTNSCSIDVTESFGSDFAFAFSSWLQRIRCTLGDVDRLFDDARLSDLHAKLPFQSGRQWQEAMSGVQAGLQDDVWIQEDIAITSGLSGLQLKRHVFIYQDIMSLVGFLIGHCPFAHEMVYAPSRVFTGDVDNPIRIYHELYSGDWWWNIQERLPDGATVVPVILAVDKTQLSLLSGDVAAWPVYITIGNLSREARRRKTTPGTLLAGFIPTTRLDSPIMKSHVYHYCMGKLLSRKYFHTYFTTVWYSRAPLLTVCSSIRGAGAGGNTPTMRRWAN
jgi:hypothetical protein